MGSLCVFSEKLDVKNLTVKSTDEINIEENFFLHKVRPSNHSKSECILQLALFNIFNCCKMFLQH